MKRLSRWLSVLMLTAAGASFSAPTLLNGAGATFPYPLYSKWFTDYQKVDPSVAINYQSLGSGAGIKQFLEKTVDFGATDAPMNDEQLGKAIGVSSTTLTPEQLKQASETVVHVPTVLGAVVITYNLPNVTKEVKLSGEVLAEIYLGKIAKWSDPKIAKLNPGVALAGDILVVHRSDGSGTTNIFTDYLTKASPAWTPGKGTAVNWPVGLGGKGNEGVTQTVKSTPGSIGYVELIYAEQNKLPYATLQNKAGKFVKPTLKSVTAAATGALRTIPDDFRVSITDAAGPDSYPISGFTYLLVYRQQPDAVKGPKLVKFLKWAITDGQSTASALGYAPLPSGLVKKVQARVETIETKKLN